MTKYSFSKQDYIRLDGDKPVDSDSNFGIALFEDLVIRDLYSTDKGNSIEERDGTLTLSINGQERALSWATDGEGKVINKKEKLKDQVLFLGDHTGVLDLGVKMIEVDIHDPEKIAEGLTKAQIILQGAAAAANFIPGVGTIVSAGLSVVGKIVDIFRGLKDNDLELAYEGSAPAPDAGHGPNPFGRYKLKRFTSPKPEGTDNRVPDVEVAFRLHPFTPLSEGDRRDVVITLESLEVETNEKPKKLSLVGDLSFGSGSSSAKFGFSVRLRNKPAMAYKVLGIVGKEVYYGKWNVGVPFHINFALVAPDKGLKQIEGLIEETSTQAQRFTSKEPVQTQISNATAAIQSLRSLLTEFLPDKKTIGVKSGLITDPGTLGHGFPSASTINPVEPGEEGKPVDIEMETTTGGKAKIKLLIKRVPLSIDADPLPEALVDEAYSAQLSASSAVEPLTWIWTAPDGKQLPAGLKLTSLGEITGKPTAAGNFSILVTVKDKDTGPIPPLAMELTVRAS